MNNDEITMKNNNIPKNSKKAKHSKKFLFIVVFFLIAIFAFLLWRFLFYKSIDKQLAEIEAQLAIPDSENAAFYYREFFNEPNNIYALEDLLYYSPSVNTEPWLDTDFPDWAKDLKRHQNFIQSIIEISKKPKVLFQIYPDPFSDHLSISNHIRKTTWVLTWAAANDLAYNRTNEALEKYLTQIRIGLHFQQQPVTSYQLVGTAIEAVGRYNIKDFIMRDDITKEQVNTIAQVLENIRNNPEPDKQLIEMVNSLPGVRVVKKEIVDGRRLGFIIKRVGIGLILQKMQQ